MTLPPFGVPTGIEHEETPVMGLSACSMPSHTTRCHDSRLTPFAWRPQLQLPTLMGNEHQQRQQLHMQLPMPMPMNDNDDDNSCTWSCQRQRTTPMMMISAATAAANASMETPIATTRGRAYMVRLHFIFLY